MRIGSLLLLLLITNQAVSDPQVPIMYTITPYGPILTESSILQGITNMVQNGMVQAGCNWMQWDAAWDDRNPATGNLEMNTNLFTRPAQWYVALAHSFGIKIMVYLSNTSEGQFGSPGSANHMLQDAGVLVTNMGVDGVKMDGPLDTNARVFWQAIIATGKPIWRQMSEGGGLPLIGPYTEFGPEITNYLNADYPMVGLNDPNSDYNFVNEVLHFHAGQLVFGYVRPGFYLEGIGWNGTSSIYNYDYPGHVYMDLAAMSCADLQLSLNGSYVAVTNTDFTSILLDPAVIPCHVAAAKIAADGQLVSELIRPLGNLTDAAAVCFLNESSLTNAMTLTAADLGFTNPVFTIYSPWFHSIEGFATNAWTINVPPANTVMYKVTAGFNPPSFLQGTNYLSNWFWRSSVNLADQFSPPNVRLCLARDIRGGNTAPLRINSTTYAKGFSVYPGTGGGLTNIYWEMPLGRQAKMLYLTFGKQQEWDGGATGSQLTIQLDGVQVFQSAWITNNPTDATNIAINVAGANAVRFNDAEAGGQHQDVLGNCLVTIGTNGAVVRAPVIALGAPDSNNHFSLTFMTQIGPTYYLETSGSPDASNWQALTNTAGTGGPLTLKVTTSAETMRFFRVLVK